MIKSWGAFVARRALTVLLVGIVVVLGAAGYGAGVFDSLSQGGFDDPKTESSRELAAEREAFGNKTVDVIAIYSSDDLSATDPAFRRSVEDTLDAIPDGVTASITTYYDTRSPDLLSTDGRSTQVLISLGGDTQNEYLENYDELAPVLEAEGLETDLAGPFATYNDVNHISETDLRKAETVSAPVVLILSLLIFGSLVAASMPVVVGVIAVLGSLAVIRVLSEFVEVSIFSVNVITLIGLGLAIDYALFIISRFREELARLPEDDPDAPAKAIQATMVTAGRTVLFSGLTVAAAMSSLLVFPQAFLKSMGYGGIAAVLVAMLAALTVLPAILRLLGRRIDAGRMPWRRHRPVSTDTDHGAWARLAHAVMRRPVIVAVAVTAVLLAVASPFLGVKWGSVDYRVLPEDAPAHVAAQKLNDEFGPERSSASLLLQGVDQAGVTAYTQDVKDVPGIVDVQPVAQDGDNTLLRAFWEGNSQSQASQDLVRELREIDPAQGTALVGGLSADTVDLTASIGDHLPWMGLIVIGVMLVLLFIAFGSLVLPIKAVLMNAISVTASFGVVTWIFQGGHFEDALGFTSPGFLDATQPILMLAILFGLSMDYEVFLLSRVREQYDRTHDNTGSVAVGVQKTGRIITSAALLLAVVIGAFSISGIVFMKMIGLGMLIALLVDATVVRALLVPATMKLLGSANWWAPAPMRRWWDRYGFREEERAAVADKESVPVG
ncbi:MAG TPA: MMPL family transporter [Nocardioidaceae bacterium]|nr:MMPL family transporter [Nocardioidaceae bacterium]